MTDIKRIAATVTLALAAPLALSGCVTPGTFEEVIPAALVASDPLIEDAFVGVASGIGSYNFHTRLYVTSVEHHELVQVVDRAFVTMIGASPQRPTSIALSVDEAPMPPNPTVGWGKVDLNEVARELGLEGQISNDVISGTIQVFEKRYGTWEDLHREWREEQE